MASFVPAYVKALENGLLDEKITKAYDLLHSCTLCPRRCRVNRIAGETGICKTGKNPWISSFNPHFGEEAPLVGSKGSGTIFFTHCNLLCNFCQNYDISHEEQGEEISPEQVGHLMLSLQETGCHNINFVTPSHVVPQILSAVAFAAGKGLRLPLVFNTGGYDAVETLRLLESVFDIYMPDFKFWDTDIAKITCDAGDYPDVARKAVLEMHRQVGDLFIDSSGIAKRGLLIRHLLLPGGLSGTRQVMRFIAQEISPDTYVNVMSQYRPCGRSAEVKALSSRITQETYRQALETAKEEGVTRLDQPRRVYRIL